MANISLYGVLLWIPMGYAIRYRSILYLKVAVALMFAVFLISALITQWSDWRVFFALALTLIILPLSGLSPILSAMSRLIERLNKANSELDTANKIKDKFLSNMSHDLLTPVSSIMGYCESAQKPTSEIKDIRTLADQLSRQIKAIIGKTVNSSLDGEERLEVFSPAELIKTNLIMVRPLANGRNIKVRIDVDDVNGLYFGASDVAYICLMNLANNAAKYTMGNSIVLGAKYADGRLSFYVSDTGLGISGEQKSKIFDRFYRVSTDGVQGLGIGLTIVKESLMKVGGTVELNSTTNSNTFTFSIPATPAPAPEPAPAPAPVNMTFKGSLLFVDDEHTARKAWSSFLRTSGYYVHVAANGREALESIESGNLYHLYVLDYRMPEMTGLQLAERIRLLDDNAKILVISADVNTDPNQIFKHALADGLIDAALGKPIYPNKLLSVINDLQKAPSSVDGALSVVDELKKLMGELDSALLLGDSRRAGEIAHQVKGAMSFLDNESILTAVRAATTPVDILAALKSLM